MTVFSVGFTFSQLIILILLIHWGANEDRRFLYTLAFLIPLQSLSFDFGILVTWYKIGFPITLVALLLGKQSFRINHSHILRPLLIFLMYVVVLTLSSAMLDYMGTPSYQLGEALGWGRFQTEYRYWVQLGSTIAVWGIVLIPAWLVRSKQDLSAVINGYVNGNLLSAFLGFYQVSASALALPGANANWFIGEGKGTFRDSSTSQVLSFDIYRLAGLGGEPKHFGAFGISAIALLIAIDLFAPERFGIRQLKFKVAILISATILTFSTGSWVGLTIILGLYLLMGSTKHQGRTFQYAFFLGIGLVIILGAVSTQTLQTIYETRVTARLGEGLISIETYEPKDAALFAYLKEHPDKIVFGTGAGGLDFKLIPYTNPTFLIKGGTITPAYFFTRFLGEFGLVGLTILFIMIVQWIRMMNSDPESQWGTSFAVSACVGLAFTSAVSLSGYLLLLSSLVVYTATDRLSLSDSRNPRTQIKPNEFRNPMIDNKVSS